MADVEGLAPLGAVDVAVGDWLGPVQPRARREHRHRLELGEGEVKVHRDAPRHARNLALGGPPASKEGIRDGEPFSTTINLERGW